MLVLRVLGEWVRIDESRLSSAQRSRLRELWSRCLVREPDDGGTEPATADISLATPDSLPRERHRAESMTLVVDDWNHVPYRLSRAVTSVALRRRVGTDLLFHAAGLAADNGDVLVLLGRSGSGKTAAASTLGKSLGYVSDESIAVRRDWTIAPYPKPLSLVEAVGRPHKVEISPHEADLREAPEGLRLGRIVLLDRQPDRAAGPNVEATALLEALAAAAAHTSGLAKLGRPLAWLAQSLLLSGDPVRLRYRDIDECVDLAHTLVHRSSPSATKWTNHPPAPPSSTPAGLAFRSRRMGRESIWVRSPYFDAVESEGRVLILNQHGTVLLDGVGTLAWLLAGQGATPDDVLAAANAAFGLHPEGEVRVVDALQRLGRRRLLTTMADR